MTSNNLETVASLGNAARQAIMWSGFFILFRDILQLGVMLALVRLISPTDYGVAALAQSLVGVISVLSFQTFSLHALQIRDPRTIDWQSHFTFAIIVNSIGFVITLITAYFLTRYETYREAAAPLAALSTVFLVEIAGTLRHRQLESTHEWRRFRLLLIAGTVLGLVTGLLTGIAGGGVWALVVQPPLFGVPAALDLFASGRFRPNFTWNWQSYRDSVFFGLNRAAALALARGRLAIEQIVLTALFNFSELGYFNRAIGLATIFVGRVGSIAMLSLYPVLTRAEIGSERFRRIASLTLRCVFWVSIPIAGYMALVASDLVALLYGPRWSSVAPLLPLAAFSTGLAGMLTVITNLMLANERRALALKVEALAQISGVPLILFAQWGFVIYLSVLVLQAVGMMLLSLGILIREKELTPRDVQSALLPPIVATLVAILSVRTFMHHSVDLTLFLRIGASSVVFCASFLTILRLVFRTELSNLLQILPGGTVASRLLLLSQFNSRR